MRDEKEAFKSVEQLIDEGEKLVEVELMLTQQELQLFAKHSLEEGVKFNDWIRKIAYEKMISL